jgi:hypothetical protein
MWRVIYTLFSVAFLLGGCASVRQVDVEVRSLSTLKSVPVAAYRFERLPSQQTPDQLQSQLALEAMAEKALAQVGMRRDESRAGYSLLIGARVQRENSDPWNDPWYGPGRFSASFGFGRRAPPGFRAGGFWGPVFPRYDSSYVRREVSLLMRDLPSGLVVFESHAMHESVSVDSNAILPLMFEAAVSGFPNPPNQPRVVRIIASQPPAIRPPNAN